MPRQESELARNDSFFDSLNRRLNGGFLFGKSLHIGIMFGTITKRAEG